jgi:23S rRNA (guanosine2251-2'-O)-methyltransferase
MPWIFGVHPVESLLEDAPETVQEVWLVQGRRPGEARTRVLDRTRERGVRFRLVNDAQLRAAVGDVVHQGVAARVGEFHYAEVEPLLEAPGPGLLVLLDEVQDPHNLGAVLRTAAGLGARGVVVPRHRAVGVTPAVVKVSAGAAGRIPVARVVNPSRFLEQARAAGWWVYGAVARGGEVPWGHALAERAVLVLGSEGRGIRPGVEQRCDVMLTLPLGTEESLNVSVAAGLLMYEWVRQRQAIEG